jgi:hypothetical protein
MNMKKNDDDDDDGQVLNRTKHVFRILNYAWGGIVICHGLAWEMVGVYQIPVESEYVTLSGDPNAIKSSFY